MESVPDDGHAGAQVGVRRFSFGFFFSFLFFFFFFLFESEARGVRAVCESERVCARDLARCSRRCVCVVVFFFLCLSIFFFRWPAVVLGSHH